MYIVEIIYRGHPIAYAREGTVGFPVAQYREDACQFETLELAGAVASRYAAEAAAGYIFRAAIY